MDASRELSVAWLVVACLSPCASPAQVVGAAERAAARAATAAAERSAAQQAARSDGHAAAANAARRTSDRVVKRWAAALCKPTVPCPLPEKVAGTYVGGAYDEVILGSETTLYRVFHDPARRFGAPGEVHSYWSRSDSRGVQAAVDRGIDVSRFGNTADNVVAIRVPAGTRVFEGRARGTEHGTPGGGSQVVVERVKPEWEVAAKAPR